MDYAGAITAGHLSLLLVGLALSYYLLRTMLGQLVRRQLMPGIIQPLRTVVVVARNGHPYLASLIPFTGGYHAYIMWATHSLSLKVGLGISVAVLVLFMSSSGWLLKSKTANMRLRMAHRLGMMVLISLLAIHRLI